MEHHHYTELGILCVVLLFLANFFQYVVRSKFSPLSKIPNAHWSCALSPAWILWARYNNRENRTLLSSHQKYGPIVRVGPNELSLSNLDGVKRVYQGGFDKHDWYSIFNNYGVPNTFSSADSKIHSLRKRMVSNVYSKSYIGSSPAFAAQAEIILNCSLLPAVAESATPRQATLGINVHSLFCATAMDFISSYCFGTQNAANFIQNESYREHWLKLYLTRKGYSFFAQEMPRVSSFSSSLGIRLTPSWVDAANRELETWCKKHCDQAVAFLQRSGTSSIGTADDPVVVRAVLAGFEKEEQLRGSDSPVYSTVILQRDLSLASEIIDHILAGQETTGVALTYSTWHLSRSLDLQDKLRSELLSLEPNLGLKDGKISMPSSKQLDSLPVLHAVVMETVRLYAPAGGPEPRVTPGPSCLIGPYKVPGGMRVSASAYNIHRDERAFPEAEVWDHTRWLPSMCNEDEVRDANRHFWGFSSGGRMCLGSNFAMHEMKLVLAAIYTNYTSHIVNDDGIEPTDAYTGHPKSNKLDLRFERVSLE